MQQTDSVHILGITFNMKERRPACINVSYQFWMYQLNNLLSSLTQATEW